MEYFRDVVYIFHCCHNHYDFHRFLFAFVQPFSVSLSISFEFNFVSTERRQTNDLAISIDCQTYTLIKDVCINLVYLNIIASCLDIRDIEMRYRYWSIRLNFCPRRTIKSIKLPLKRNWKTNEDFERENIFLRQWILLIFCYSMFTLSEGRLWKEQRVRNIILKKKRKYFKKFFVLLILIISINTWKIKVNEIFRSDSHSICW